MVDDPATMPADEPLLRDVAVLLVDDDEQWARVTARLLEAADDAFDIETAHSLAAGRDRFDATDPECVICDDRSFWSLAVVTKRLPATPSAAA